MEKNLSNEDLLLKYSSLVPTAPGESPVIFADTDTSPKGNWALFIKFVATMVKSIHPLKGAVETLTITVNRAMCNVNTATLADLGDVEVALPANVDLHRDFQFVAHDKQAPKANFAVQSGYQPFTNSNGMGSFNSKGELLMVNEFIAPKGTEGKVHAFPTDQRLTPIRKSNNPALSAREAFFDSYAQAYGTRVKQEPEPVF